MHLRILYEHVGNGYKDGKSIFQFNFNKDLPGTNRWVYLQKQSFHHMEAKDFFKHGTNRYVVDDTFFMINDGLNEESIETLVDYNNGTLETIMIQSNILLKFEIVDCFQTSLLIEFNNCIYGCILIYWDVDSPNMNIDNVVCKKCILCGGGKFWTPVRLNDYPIEWNNDVSGNIVPLLHSCILNKTKIPMPYNSNLTHQIGLSTTTLHCLWDGDNKHLYDLFGMAGSRSKYFCEYCLHTLNEMQSDPTPTNRCFKTRSSVQIEQHAMDIAANNNYSQDTHHSIKYQPLLYAGPWSLGLAVVHIIQGPTPRLLTIVAACIRFQQTNTLQIKQWNGLCDDIDNLKQEIQQYSDTIEWMNIKDNHECFDKSFIDNLSTNMQQLKVQVQTKKQQLSNKQKELQCLEKTMSKTNGEMNYLELCDELNIKPWHHKGDSMIGPSCKKFLYNWKTVIKTLKKYDRECARLMEPCLARLCFLTKCIWTKNKEKFDDNCCYYLRFNMIEFDLLYHKIIRKYGGGATGERFGVKWHMLYHCVEWIEGLKWSPAHLDDQRIEAWNRHMEKYLTIFHCFGGHVNMQKMMNKIWRAFILQ